MADFDQAGITIVAASVDSVEDARQTATTHGLSFPVAWGLDARSVAARTGAFFEPGKGFLHATGFVIDPGGRVAAALYSTGPVGRYAPADCLGLVRAMSGE